MRDDQGRMDFGSADLPLFSGTPVSVSVTGELRSNNGARQVTFAACRVCLDTGEVEVRRGKVVWCTCAVGIAARRRERDGA